MTEDETTRSHPAGQTSPFLNTAQAAQYLRLAPRRLERMRVRGGGPPFRRHARLVVYHLDDLMAWSNASRSERAGE
ncbi:helix-turn-helix transcriptional regulator [Novosphingobium malaysiense]|uniref:Helix-turn-helix domain-containing protein n=1 Tax=Novosphingobium malaysiense TaxID=1348853 RepID=A0A0B1ZIG4_9SPHN|nr:helix-turn-helix domain-containing protein [Novosphingobium malaysiense]KHK89068.1 hypothetical protein LK12_22235 [Novosphingobium malaysiense]